jgi:8-oxo-dGTP pyrophosphatase MutT (NUDIX family)
MEKTHFDMNNIKSYDEFLFEYLDVVQRLAGVLVVVDDKVLLVKSQKSDGKWSIPKGKMKKLTILDTAISELREETGIRLSKDKTKETERKKVIYKKGDKIKELIAFVVKMDKSDLNVDMNKKWEVHKKHFDTDEVYKVKFFTRKQAMDKLETGQIPLLKFI